MNLEKLGWNREKIDLEEKYSLGRVTTVFKNKYKVHTEDREFLADLKGLMIYDKIFPAVGDWVILENELIIEILPRTSKISRHAAGKVEIEQVISSNIDYVFIVSSLNHDFNLSRLERYLTMVWDSGAVPVFILTKADIADDYNEKLLELEKIAYGVPIHVTSSMENIGIEELDEYFNGNKTVTFIGSSGVGKSTLINKLMGEEVLKTQELRKDGKGRHTTTYREMFFIEKGGIIIDTPGMREIQLWGGDVETTFEDIEAIALECKFKDCSHEDEPNCAVRDAVESGELSEKRLRNYKKLKRELGYDGLDSKQLDKKKMVNMMGSLNGVKKMRKFSQENNLKKNR